MDQVIHYLNVAVSQLQHIPSGVWQALLASGILSPLINVVKKIHLTKKEQAVGEKALYFVVIGAAFLVSVFQYLLTQYPSNPKIIAIHTVVLTFMMQPIYLFAVKPLWTYLGSQFGEAAKLQAAAKSAVVPPEGLPVAGTSVSNPSAQQVFDQTISKEDFSN